MDVEVDEEEQKKLEARRREKQKARSERYQRILEEKAAKRAEKNKYRDRVKERRLAEASGKADQEDEDRFKDLDDGLKQYLGGTLESTHLVKGLDLQLLQKTRAEEEMREEEELERLYREQELKKMEVQAVSKPSGPTFVTPIGRSLFRRFAADSITARRSSRDAFCRGMMSFEFDSKFTSYKDTPTALYHSAADVDAEGGSEPEPVCGGSLPLEIISAVRKAFTYLQSGRSGSKNGGSAMPKEETGGDFPTPSSSNAMDVEAAGNSSSSGVSSSAHAVSDGTSKAGSGGRIGAGAGTAADSDEDSDFE